MSILSKCSTQVFAAVVAAASFAAVSHAQTPKTPMQATVPFAFQSGDVQVPAGVYTMKIENPQIVSFAGSTESGRKAWMALPMRAENGPGKVSQMVFRKYGEKCFLGEVWVAGQTSHLYFVPTKAERQAKADARRADGAELSQGNSSGTGLRVALPLVGVGGSFGTR